MREQREHEGSSKGDKNRPSITPGEVDEMIMPLSQGHLDPIFLARKHSSNFASVFGFYQLPMI